MRLPIPLRLLAACVVATGTLYAQSMPVSTAPRGHRFGAGLTIGSPYYFGDFSGRLGFLPEASFRLYASRRLTLEIAAGFGFLSFASPTSGVFDVAHYGPIPADSLFLPRTSSNQTGESLLASGSKTTYLAPISILLHYEPPFDLGEFRGNAFIGAGLLNFNPTSGGSPLPRNKIDGYPRNVQVFPVGVELSRDLEQDFVVFGRLSYQFVNSDNLDDVHTLKNGKDTGNDSYATIAAGISYLFH